MLQNSQHWKVEIDKKTKYSIKSDGKLTSLHPAGQKINVKLPFSGEEYYSEYLVNNEYIEKAFAKKRMVREMYGSFESLLDEFKSANFVEYKKLTEADKKWCSLYYYVAYRKP